ncbi:hypothetical protein RJ639_046691 [Escallonia herrerae]|uniref:Retrotransposon gag domain-containing protein n=1 Tax=Escallonia herrerae TaxID=1293975 RepID=A0AA88W835_9ASTE|nr:hypothetical protein RJ639_046691 [Escallonia herrerae]
MKTQLKACGEPMQQTIATQLDLVFKRPDELEADKRLCLEKVPHFTKKEVQRRKDLKEQVAELQNELTVCRRKLTRAPRQGGVAVLPKRKKVPEPTPKTDDGRKTGRQLYFEGLDIKGEEEKVQTATIWEEFKRELKRQFYSESVEDLATINLRRLKQKGSIREYVKEYSTLMPEIPKMSERQQLCFFINRLQQWIATKLRRRKSRDLALAMAIGKKHEGCKGEGSRDKGGKGALEVVAFTVESCIVPKNAHTMARGNTLQASVDMGANHSFMSSGVAEKLGLKPSKDRSWFKAVNAKEQFIKNVDMRICGLKGKADLNIINLDKHGEMLGMDFMEKSSVMLSSYCGVMRRVKMAN